MLQSALMSPGRLLTLLGKNGAFLNVLAVIVGMSAPWLAPITKPWLPVATGVAAFGAFLSASYSVERTWLQPHVAGAILWVVLGPVLILGCAATYAGLEPGLLTGIILAAVAPSSSGVPSFASLLRLSPKLALVTFACVSAVAPFTMPLLAAAFGVTLQIDKLQYGLKLLAIIGGGGMCALIVKRYLHAFRWILPAQAAATGTSALGLFGIYIVSASVARQQLDLASDGLARFMGIAVAVYVLMVLISALVFIRLGMKDAVTIGLLSGNRNVTVAWAAATSQIPAAAEAYIATASLLNALMPITLQQTTRMIERVQRRTRLKPIEVSWYESDRPLVFESKFLDIGRKYRIGRGIDCDIRLPAPAVSRLHAEIEILPSGEAVVTDLGSSNGMIRDGRRVPSAKLTEGEEVRIAAYHVCLGHPRPILSFAMWADMDTPEVVQSRGLVAGRFKIGRSSEADITLRDGTVSAMHAELSIDNSGTATIADLGSTNGLLHKGQRTLSLRLAEGEDVQIGRYLFSVRSAGAVEEPAQPLAPDPPAQLVPAPAARAPHT